MYVDGLQARLDSLVDAWRRGDALHAGAHFTIDATYREAGREPVVGREAILEHFTRFFRDGPQWEFMVDECLIVGRRGAVVYRFRLKGRTGDWLERAGCAIVSFGEDGSILQWREYEG